MINDTVRVENRQDLSRNGVTTRVHREQPRSRAC
jgi:hypothetical protein